MSKLFIIILIAVTAITTLVVTLKLSEKPKETVKQETEANPFNYSPLPTPTPTPRPQPVIQRQQTPIPAPVQDTALKIEQCKVKAQMSARQAAQDWFSQMILQIPSLCQNSYESDCSLKWTKSFSESANNIEYNQYYPTLYSQCLNQ